MTIALGIDVGATIGLAHFDGKRMTSGGDTRDINDVIKLLKATSEPMVVAIEGIEMVYSRARFGASMATALVKAARQAGELVATAQHAGHTVIEVPANVWRKGLTGNGHATDAMIKAALLPVIGKARTNAHVRDALGLARHGWLWSQTPDGREAMRCDLFERAVGR